MATSFSTGIGTVAPGVTYMDTSGAFHGIAASAANEVLVSSGAGSYVFLPEQNLPSPSYSTGALQIALFNLGGAAFPSLTVTQTGSATSNYSAAAEVMSFNFVPHSPTSQIQINYSFSMQNSQTFAFANIYFFGAQGVLTPFASTGDTNYQTGNTAGKCQASLHFPDIAFVDVIPVSICMFKSGIGTCTAGNPSDFVMVTEFAQSTPLPPYTVTFSLSGATPTLITTFNASGSSAPQSLYISGSVLFADVANLISVTIPNFQFLVQYNGATTTCTVGPSSATAAAPSLQYTVVGNVVSVYGVGIAGQSFTGSYNYTFLQGGI